MKPDARWLRNTLVVEVSRDEESVRYVRVDRTGGGVVSVATWAETEIATAADVALAMDAGVSW